MLPIVRFKNIGKTIHSVVYGIMRASCASFDMDYGDYSHVRGDDFAATIPPSTGVERRFIVRTLDVFFSPNPLWT